MTVRLYLPLLFVTIAPGVIVAQQPNPPQIVFVTFSGPNSVTHSTGAHGLNASLGAWDDGFPVHEDAGTTTLRIVVNVNDGGHLKGWHWLQTVDTKEYLRPPIDYRDDVFEVVAGPDVIAAASMKRFQFGRDEKRGRDHSDVMSCDVE